MPRFLARLLLIAFVFYFVLPMIPGYAFYGNILHAIGAGLLFTVIGWVVEVLAIVFSTVFAITTFGVGLLFLIPAWLLGFWLLPAVAIKWLAGLLPAYMTVNGWSPAIWGGLIMLLVGVVTSDGTRKIPERRTNPARTRSEPRSEVS